MVRCVAGLVAIALCCGTNLAQAARPLGNVVPQETAQIYGLQRAWATRIQLDPSRGRLVKLKLQAGLLLAQTDQATLHVLNAETRETLWIGHVGRPGSITTAPAANEKYVVSTNGGELFLFDRAKGRVLWSRKLPSVPIAGPAISDSRVYVPMVSGMLTTFRLPNASRKEETALEQKLKDNALNYTGKGVTFEPPVVTRSNVVWGTDAGNIYAVKPDDLLAVYRFKARGPVGGLMYRPPYVYATSRDGYVYCLRETNELNKGMPGSARWQFSIGNPIAETPMATDDGVYAIPETGGLYKLDPQTGQELWAVPGVFQFVSASPTRIYTADSAGRLLILNAKTGRRQGSISTEGLTIKVFNRDNDRIYLATATGLVQCLREIGLKQPVGHALAAVKDAVKASGKTEGKAEGEDDEAKGKKEADEEGPDPFGAEDKEMKDDDKMEDDK